MLNFNFVDLGLDTKSYWENRKYHAELVDSGAIDDICDMGLYTQDLLLNSDKSPTHICYAYIEKHPTQKRKREDDSLTLKKRRAFGVSTQGNLVGFCVFRLDDSKLHIDVICAKGPRGTGTLLMNRVIDFSKATLDRDIYVTLETVPDAYGFYKKIGFEEIGHKLVKKKLVPMSKSTSYTPKREDQKVSTWAPLIVSAMREIPLNKGIRMSWIAKDGTYTIVRENNEYILEVTPISDKRWSCAIGYHRTTRNCANNEVARELQRSFTEVTGGGISVPEVHAEMKCALIGIFSGLKGLSLWVYDGPDPSSGFGIMYESNPSNVARLVVTFGEFAALVVSLEEDRDGKIKLKSIPWTPEMFIGHSFYNKDALTDDSIKDAEDYLNENKEAIIKELKYLRMFL